MRHAQALSQEELELAAEPLPPMAQVGALVREFVLKKLRAGEVLEIRVIDPALDHRSRGNGHQQHISHGNTAVGGVHDYNNKFVEFAHANIKAAFDFAYKLSGVNSPSAFLELSTEHAREQFETLAEQTKQLAALAQKVTLATAEPLKTGFAKAFNHTV
jgi:hypothetical protein